MAHHKSEAGTMKPMWHLSCALALVAGQVTAQARVPTPAPSDLIARAVAAMGGEPALRAIHALSVDAYSVTFAVVQEETPESPPRANVSSGGFVADYGGGRFVSTIDVRNVTGAVNRLRRGTAGGIGMLVTDGQPAPMNPWIGAA